MLNFKNLPKIRRIRLEDVELYELDPDKDVFVSFVEGCYTFTVPGDFSIAGFLGFDDGKEGE